MHLVKIKVAWFQNRIDLLSRNSYKSATTCVLSSFLMLQVKVMMLQVMIT